MGILANILADVCVSVIVVISYIAAQQSDVDELTAEKKVIKTKKMDWVVLSPLQHTPQPNISTKHFVPLDVGSATKKRKRGPVVWNSGHLMYDRTTTSKPTTTPKLFTAWPPFIYQEMKCPKCPTCFKYDTSRQANTLEEAILNFPDLTASEPAKLERLTPFEPPERRGKIPGTATSDSFPHTGRCTDPQCAACSISLLGRLSSVGMINVTQSLRVLRNLGIPPRRSLREQCSKYRFTRQQLKPATAEWVGRVSPMSMNSSYRTGFVKAPSQFVYGDHVDSVPEELCLREKDADMQWERIQKLQTSKGGRHKRQNTEDPELLGTRYVLSCVKRGESEDVDDDSWVVQCDMCWAWRVLPPHYKPRYINELLCDPYQKGKCLGGYGKCQQRDNLVDVQRNFGTDESENWQTERISAGNCCDCKILNGSPLHNLIAR